jgi:glycerophosphoryl diester phosphodiesterase
MEWLNAPPCVLLGHRGVRNAAPENTLHAFALALEQGADGFEFDVKLSADGIPVVIHDGTVDRTTNGRGSVAALTVAELQQLDAGGGQPIPTLDDVFARFGGGVLYNVELKTLELEAADLEQAVVAAIRRHDVAAQVLISSFNPKALERAGRIGPDLALGFLHAGPGRLLLPEVPLLALHPRQSQADAAYLAWAAAHGYRVHVWTVNDAAAALALRRQGVHALISDQPLALHQAFSAAAGAP